MAYGISNDLYWRLTREEVTEVLKVAATREHAANMRAGLIAATIINANPYRKKGARTTQPGDFFRGRRRYMEPEEAQKFMDGWAATHNKQQEEVPREKK